MTARRDEASFTTEHTENNLRATEDDNFLG